MSSPAIALSVFGGRGGPLLGHIVDHHGGGVEAFDAKNIYVGTFESVARAAAALWHGAHDRSGWTSIEEAAVRRLSASPGAA
jgi:hypothetical protein